MVSQPCGSNFRHHSTVANNKHLCKSQVRCDIVNSDNSGQGVDNIVPNALDVCKQVPNVGSDLKSVPFPTDGQIHRYQVRVL